MDTTSTMREVLLLQSIQEGSTAKEIASRYFGLSEEKIPTGSIYTTLSRMEEKIYIHSQQSSKTTRRSENRKHFTITESGRRVLKNFETIVSKLILEKRF